MSSFISCLSNHDGDVILANPLCFFLLHDDSLQTKETFAEVKGVDDTNERVQEDENAGEDNGTVGGKTKEETTGMDSHDRATIDTEEGTMLVFFF